MTAKTRIDCFFNGLLSQVVTETRREAYEELAAEQGETTRTHDLLEASFLFWFRVAAELGKGTL